MSGCMKVQVEEKFFTDSNRDQRRLILENISFSLSAGELVAIVGPSGCGKSTLARLVVRLLAPTGGSIRFDGREIGRISPYLGSGLA